MRDSANVPMIRQEESTLGGFLHLKLSPRRPAELNGRNETGAATFCIVNVGARPGLVAASSSRLGSAAQRGELAEQIARTVGDFGRDADFRQKRSRFRLPFLRPEGLICYNPAVDKQESKNEQPLHL